MKRLLRNIFGFYALLIFIATLVLATICYFIVFSLFSKKKAPFIAHQYISRTWAKALFFFFAIRIKILNQKLLDPDQTYVFIANHRSQLDIPAYAVAAKHTIRFLAKSELSKIPLMGYIIRNLYVSVNRQNKAARAKSMDNMINSLNDKISVFICPEGTRNKTADLLLPFHDGAFRLAIQSQLPLATMVIINSDGLLSPLDPVALSPGTITCTWCEPISTKGMTQDDLPVLKEMARAKMETIYLHER